VFYKNAAMANWVIDNAGLPTFTNGNILKPFYRDGKIRLATYGKGIWESQLNEQADAPICRITVDKLSQTVYCVSDSFYFEDHSFINHQGATWNWSFPTGSPSTSTDRNPAVFFAAPGNHLAILTVTNQQGLTDQDTLIVSVNNFPAPTMIQEDFQGSFVPQGWFQTNLDGNGQWLQSSDAGGFGLSTKSTIFDNYNYDSQGTTDDLNALLSTQNMSQLQLSFDVAYAPWGGSYSDTLIVLASTDCGATFSPVYSKGGTTLATAPAFTEYYVPTATEWRTETINLNAFTGHPDVVVAFRNKGHWGNVIYVDNVNITNNLSTQQLMEQELTIYPNPLVCSQELTVSGIEEAFSIRIRDLNGKTVYFNQGASSTVKLPSSIQTGQYIVTIETAEHIWNKKLIVKQD
jgi:PKD repeat protein